MERWRAEIAAVGWPAERLAAAVDAARRRREEPGRLSVKDARAVVSDVLADDGELARRKVFSRRHLVVALAPHLFGQTPEVLDRLVDRALADPDGGAPGRCGRCPRNGALARLCPGPGGRHRRGPGPPVGAAPTPPPFPWRRSRKPSKRPSRTSGPGCQKSSGRPPSPSALRGAGPSWSWVWPGPARPPCCGPWPTAFERAGCEVIGTATSGQAARNLGHEAEIAQSRTLASLIWRLDHGQMALTEKTVVILDEVGMTDDADLARLAAYTELAGAKLVLTGDHRQLGRSARAGRWGRW